MQEVTGYVYVAHAPNRGLYKIGQSINPEQRMLSIAPAAEQVQLVLKIPSSDSWWLERHLHKAFVAKSAGGEWFKLSQVDIRLLGSIAHADSEKDLPRKINDLAFRGRNVRRKSPPVFVTGGKRMIRLDVERKHHDVLRVLAAKSKMPMSKFCEALVLEAVEREWIPDASFISRVTRKKPGRPKKDSK